VVLNGQILCQGPVESPLIQVAFPQRLILLHSSSGMNVQLLLVQRQVGCKIHYGSNVIH